MQLGDYGFSYSVPSFLNLTLIHKLLSFPKFSDLFSPKAIKLHGTVMTGEDV